ncbi:MAG: glycoside hydrolase family 172 protein [Promethearchaeota archaeon]
MKMGYSALSNLPKIREGVKRKRISSYDKTGANFDFIHVPQKEKHVVCNIEGAGCIKHIWMTMASPDPYYLRKVLIRMWWDGEENPSVECPIGDFFGVGHSKCVNFWSLPLAMGPQDGKGFNCWFPMPYSQNARIEIENYTDIHFMLYYYIDYEEHEKVEENLGRFHACWNRENPCKGSDYQTARKVEKFRKKNLTHEDDYVVLEAKGKGLYVGCHLDIHNLLVTDKHNWPGEGNDYVVIDDGEIVINGTGTEDYFSGAYCPAQYYCSPYFGVILPGGKNWSGKITYYRYHVEDPIYFNKNITVKIEHGHANQRSDDWSSTAYWYQIEPHKKFKEMAPVEKRIPREEPKGIDI